MEKNKLRSVSKAETFRERQRSKCSKSQRSLITTRISASYLHGGVSCRCCGELRFVGHEYPSPRPFAAAAAAAAAPVKSIERNAEVRRTTSCVSIQRSQYKNLGTCPHSQGMEAKCCGSFKPHWRQEDTSPACADTQTGSNTHILTACSFGCLST